MCTYNPHKMQSGTFVRLVKGLLLSSFVVLAGCSSLELKVIEDMSPHEGKGSCGFDGLRKKLEVSDKLHVVAVHGMGHHTPNWSCVMRKNVFKTVGLTSPADSLLCEKNIENHETEMGAISLEFGYLSGNTEKAKYYELTYSDITSKFKTALTYDKEYDDYRVAVPKCLKTGCKKFPGLMNDNISDAFIYLGVANDEVQKSMDEALAYISDKVGPNDQVIFIAESLGSRVIFDALLDKRIIQSESGTNKLIQKSTQLWLLSNQLPLLQLGKNQKGEGGSSLERFIVKKLEIDTLSGLENKKTFQVVAFSDPNDLLTFPIGHNLAQKNKGTKFYNALINNNSYAFLGFVNPYKAHVGYRTNEKVMNAIAEGANCSLDER